MKRFAACCGALFVTACGSPSAPSQQRSAAPIAKLSIVVDNGAVMALNGASIVTFDATQSAGSDLRYQVDFGDGAHAEGAVTKHVYARSAGPNDLYVVTYPVRLTVIDSYGRNSMTSGDVPVAKLALSWTAHVPRAEGFDHYEILVTGQKGTSLAGEYSDGRSRLPFTGELVGNRGVVISVADGSVTLDGRSPNGFDSPAFSFAAAISGGTADGAVLTFANLYKNY